MYKTKDLQNDWQWIKWELEGWKCIASVKFYTSCSKIMRKTKFLLASKFSEFFMRKFSESLQVLTEYVDRGDDECSELQERSNRFWGRYCGRLS